jgi:DNA polymerase type B, organellar and viral
MTPEECRAYVEEFYRINKVRLDADLISKNPVKRAIAKYIMNSLWGKLGAYTPLDPLFDLRVVFPP